MKKVSIIVPVYNAEKYLPRCIESILIQQYKNIELILINDGSEDISGSICDKYAELDNRVKVIHQKNYGVSSARNKGLELAIGDYISFVDSDDYVHPEIYTKMQEAMEKHNADIVSCMIKIVTETGKQISRVTGIKKNITILNQINTIILFPKNELISYSPCDKLYSAKILKNIKFNKDIKILEDCLFVCQTLFNSNTYVILPEYLYYYVLRNDSAIHSKFSEDNLDVVIALKKCIEIYDNNSPEHVKLMKNELLINLINMLVRAVEENTDHIIIDKICRELDYFKNYKYNGRVKDKIKIFLYFKALSIKPVIYLKNIYIFIKTLF